MSVQKLFSVLTGLTYMGLIFGRYLALAKGIKRKSVQSSVNGLYFVVGETGADRYI